jgi:hypothetical protein
MNDRPGNLTKSKLDHAQESPELERLMIKRFQQPSRPPTDADWRKVEQRLRKGSRRAA